MKRPEQKRKRGKPKTSPATAARRRGTISGADAGFEGIAVVRNGVLLEANPQLSEMFGYRPAELTGMPLSRLIAPRSRPSVTACLSTGDEAGIELHALKRDGSTFPVEIRTRRHGRGRQGTTLLVVRDITVRKGTEELLRESEESYRELAEGITDVFFAVDRDLTVTYWNKASEYLTGISARDAISGHLFQLLPALNTDVAIQAFGSVLESLEPKSFVAEMTLSDRPIIAEIRVYSTRRGLSIFLDDITRQERAASALRESEERFRNIYEESPIGIQLYGADGNPLHANRALRDIVGVASVEEMKDLSLLTDPNLTEDAASRLHSGTTVRFDTLLDFDRLRQSLPTSRSGVAHIDVQITPLGARDGPSPAGYLVQVQETTERKRAEAQIKSSLEEKEALLKEIHHRVKNNLQIVSSLLSLQSEYITNEKALEALKESQNRVRSMAMIHRQLYSSGDLARIDFEHYVRDLADQIFRTYSLQSGSISLELQIDPIPLTIDKAIPCGIIVNELLSNCLKHAFTGRATGKITIALHRTQERLLELKVGDDGVGIPQELNVSEAPSLGLRLVRTLADQLKGTLRIDQAAGTAFTITFPIE